jgi:hypothetical protein
MLSAIATETMSAFTKSFLEILVFPRRWASVGVDCEPWLESGASALTIDLRLIPDAILLHRGLSTQDEIDPTGIDEPFHIPEFTRLASDTSPSAIAPGDRKWRARSLSSNQVELGLSQSPRSDHLTSVHGRMSVAISAEFSRISGQLDGIFTAQLNPHNLGSCVSKVAAILHIPPPSARRRIEYLRWLDANREQAMPILAALHP